MNKEEFKNYLCEYINKALSETMNELNTNENPIYTLYFGGKKEAYEELLKDIKDK